MDPVNGQPPPPRRFQRRLRRPKRRPRWSKRVQEGSQTVPERSKTASFGPETVREAHRRLKMAPREKVWNQDFRKV